MLENIFVIIKIKKFMEEQNKGFTPDYIDKLLPNEIFVFGSNALGYHTGGASGTARKKFGAVWGRLRDCKEPAMLFLLILVKV